jgi:hypothetical protein
MIFFWAIFEDSEKTFNWLYNCNYTVFLRLKNSIEENTPYVLSIRRIIGRGFLLFPKEADSEVGLAAEDR